MITFQWTSKFLTGFDSVDTQHRRLVDLINNLGEGIGKNKVDPSDLESLFAELFQYARTHFSDEEHLMHENGIDSHHTRKHIASHKAFLDDIIALKNGGMINTGEMAASLLDYLVHWLSYHILGQDQDMAHQIRAIRDGMTAAAAYEEYERSHESVEPLMAALNGLLQQLSKRSSELMDLNRHLEQRVKERTLDLSEANEKLEVLSQTDALTGLPNRRQAMIRLGELWTPANKGVNPLALLMIDADNFKQVNDHHGHDAGDHVLVELSRTLKDSVRNDDVVCRLGGDEFLVICPATGPEGATHLARLLLQKVSDLRVGTGDEFWNSGISIGMAVQTPSMQNFDELIKAADDGLYQAKRAGRNCVLSSQATF